MPTKPRKSTKRSALRRLIASEEDIAAARKILELIAGRGGRVDSEISAETTISDSRDRAELVYKAREICSFRERRLHAFSFTATPPFVLLLTLYANEEWEPAMMLTRLNQLSWITMSTALRWLDLLVDEGWVERREDSEDARKTLLSLTPKARAKLDDLLTDSATFGDSAEH